MKKFIWLAFVFAMTGACHNNQNNQNELKTEETMELKHADWTKDKVIYEVNLRQYTEDGSFRSFEKHLERLKNLGVDILWFMPLHPIGIEQRKGTLGSYYSVRDYYAIDSMYGTLDDFKSLVHKIHEMGMYVIIDWVANHTSRDHPWIQEHPDWYNHDSAGNIIAPYDWTDVADLNYDNPEMRKAMIEAMKWWLKETNIDGFRCDVAMLVPVDFWNDARKELESVNPDIFMLAEAEEPPLQEKAFDMYYGWKVHHLTKDIAHGEKNPEDLIHLLEQQKQEFPEYTYRMNFTSNHDENSWNGTAFERYGDALRVMSALMFVLPDMPLIYSGQEAGLNKSLAFFEKDLIEWKDSPWFEFYKKLIHLKKQNQALWNGRAGGEVEFIPDLHEKVLTFYRQKDSSICLFVANMSPEKVEFELESDVLNRPLTDFFSGETLNQGNKWKLSLNPWDFKILTGK